MGDGDDGHDHGLAHDIARLLAVPLARRRAIGLIAGGGAVAGAVLAGRIVPATAARPAGCVAYPEETAGPFPADGSRGWSGDPPDVLAASGIVRSDIRANFAGKSGRAVGVPVTLTLQLAGAGRGCAALAGHAVYLWQCDAAGRYSLYTAADDNYLRGVQAADGRGRVTFRTIFPAAYDGRFPHMHIAVYRSLDAAARHARPLLTSQLAMPRAVAETVYRAAPAYGASGANLRGLDHATDYVFGDNGRAEMAAMTPAMTGSVATGYTARAIVGVA